MADHRMEKLAQYFQRRKNRQQTASKKPKQHEDTSSDSEDSEAQFPELTPQEEQEIFDGLGIKPPEGKSAKEVICGTLRSFKQVKLLSGDSSDGVGDEPLEDYGTVRIKTDEGTKFGTLRGRKGARELFLQELDSPPPAGAAATEEEDVLDYGTVRIKNLSSSTDNDGDNFGTVRINDLATTSASDSSETPLWMQKDKPQFEWRKPEDWELAILALERGEYDPTTMQEDAFRKYKKERPKLSSLSGIFFIDNTAADKKDKDKDKSKDKDKKRTHKRTSSKTKSSKRSSSGRPEDNPSEKKRIFKREKAQKDG